VITNESEGFLAQRNHADRSADTSSSTYGERATDNGE
jgi:hypothetical protein